MVDVGVRRGLVVLLGDDVEGCSDERVWAHAFAILFVDGEALEVEARGELGGRLRARGLVRAVLGDVVRPVDVIALQHRLCERGQRRGSSRLVYRIDVIEPVPVQARVLVDVEAHRGRARRTGLHRRRVLGRGELLEIGRHGRWS